jgi:hypothetical protein
MRTPVFVIGPKVVQLWLDEYSDAMKLEDPTVHLHYTFVEADLFDSTFTASTPSDTNFVMTRAKDFLKEVSLSLGLKRYIEVKEFNFN